MNDPSRLPGELSHAQQWHVLDQGMFAVYQHHFRTGHPREFFVSMRVLEYVCSKCGEVLFEGPAFVDYDGRPEWRSCSVGRRSRSWLREFGRKIARERQ